MQKDEGEPSVWRDHVWSVDFVHDKLSNDRRYKVLTVLDEYTRQALAVEVCTRMTAVDVLEVIYRLILRHGKPVHVRSDNVLCREVVAASVSRSWGIWCSGCPSNVAQTGSAVKK